MLAAAVLAHAAASAATNFTHTYERKRLDGLLTHKIPTLICQPAQSTQLGSPLLVFAHGFLITAEDYGYLCRDLPDAGFTVALIDAEATIPSAVDMSGFADDVKYLVPHLQQQSAENASSVRCRDSNRHDRLDISLKCCLPPPRSQPLFGTLARSSAVFGHSAGGSITFEAVASLQHSTNLSAMAALAPRASGYTKYAAEVDVPSLIMVGSQDCASTNGLAPSALPLYTSMQNACKTLVSTQRRLDSAQYTSVALNRTERRSRSPNARTRSGGLGGWRPLQLHDSRARQV